MLSQADIRKIIQSKKCSVALCRKSAKTWNLMFNISYFPQNKYFELPRPTQDKLAEISQQSSYVNSNQVKLAEISQQSTPGVKIRYFEKREPAPYTLKRVGSEQPNCSKSVQKPVCKSKTSQFFLKVFARC